MILQGLVLFVGVGAMTLAIGRTPAQRAATATATAAAGAGVVVQMRLAGSACLTPSQIARAVSEANRIWRDSRVSVSILNDATSMVPDYIVSLHLMSDPRLPEAPHRPLAWLAVDHTKSPAIYVSLSVLEDFLSDADYRGRPLRQRPASVRDDLIAQAVGRVVAHEIGHVLFPGERHAESGLMRPSYSPQELLDWSIERFHRRMRTHSPPVQR